MKLVHNPLMPWIAALSALSLTLSIAAVAQVASQPHASSFNPAEGFKPAQTNLTEIFLQLAGSLEYHGSPEPYIRHMQAEHKRISALYEQKTGKSHQGRMPMHMSKEYIDRYLRNWNSLSEPLKLDEFAREIGRCAREGIRGTRLTGTDAVKLFNEHQAEVAKMMQGESSATIGFEELKRRLTDELEFAKTEVTMVGYETTRRDAVSYVLVIRDRFERMSEKIDSVAKPEKAAAIKQAITGAFLDLGYLAESELEIAILESALKQL